MLATRLLRAVIGTVVILVIAGCGAGRANPTPTGPLATATVAPTGQLATATVALPAITMTNGGGLDPMSSVWTIAPDGSLTFTEETRIEPMHTTFRSGRLTDAQRSEIARLANDPALLTELRAAHGPCSVSDGPDERLEVGPVRYRASWCKEHRRHIDHLRTRIVALTLGS